MSVFPNRDIMDKLGEYVVSIQQKEAIDLAVKLFKAIEKGHNVSQINAILNQWKSISTRGNDININQYRLNADSYLAAEESEIMPEHIIWSDSGDWGEGLLTPIDFLIWSIQEMPLASLVTNQDEIIKSLLEEMMRARKKVAEQAARKKDAVSLPPLFKDSEIEKLNEALSNLLRDVAEEGSDDSKEIQVVKNMIKYFHESTNKESTNKSGSKKKTKKRRKKTKKKPKKSKKPKKTKISKKSKRRKKTEGRKKTRGK